MSSYIAFIEGFIGVHFGQKKARYLRALIVLLYSDGSMIVASQKMAKIKAQAPIALYISCFHLIPQPTLQLLAGPR